MPSLRLSNPFRRDPERPTLKQRAKALRTTAAKALCRKPLAVRHGESRGQDAEMLAIGELLDAVAAEFDGFHSTYQRAQEQAAEAHRAATASLAGKRGPDLRLAWDATEAPYSADLKRGEALSDMCDRVSRQALARKPTTLPGAAVIARAVRLRWRDDFRKDPAARDFSASLVVALVEAVLALANTETALPPA